MSLPVGIGLFLVAAAGGALNSVAGGGSFLCYPALLAAGIAPVAANATTTVVLWPAGLASSAAYRHELGSVRRLLAVLVAPSLIGGVLGSLLLTRTADATFERILPGLLAFATLLLSFGPAISKRLRAHDHQHSRVALAITALVQLVISIYGGYFGGGMGVMMLAALTLLGMTHIHQMNALKVLLGLAINGVAIVTFVLAHLVDWAPATVMIAGAIAGGFLGAWLARRTDPARMRVIVLVLAWSVTAFFFWRAFAR